MIQEPSPADVAAELEADFDVALKEYRRRLGTCPNCKRWVPNGVRHIQQSPGVRGGRGECREMSW